MQKKYKFLLGGLFFVAVLVLVFFFAPDGSKEIEEIAVPSLEMEETVSIPEVTATPSPEPVVLSPEPEESPEVTEVPAESETPTSPSAEPEHLEKKEETKTETSETPQQETPPATEEPKPEKKAPSCTLAVVCDDIVKNAGKQPHIPENGIILGKKQVMFTEGESVFDVLKRELQNNGIHMEFTITPIYDTAYIEGIANIYEFDYGDTSGWMYAVNGKTPTYGCSQYILQDGDDVVFFYRCSLY